MGNAFSTKKSIRLEAETLQETPFICYTEVSSATQNASIEHVTDQTFGTASNLLLPSHPTSVSNVPEEKNTDGWIVKRHDLQARVTVRLCNTSHIFGFDVDTTGFTTTCPTDLIIEGYRCSKDETNGLWYTLVQEEKVRENGHNFFQIANDTHLYSRVRLSITPGGAIARFRTYGEIVPNLKDTSKEYNLASAQYGARIVRSSDPDHADKSHILLDNSPSAGWLTPRSRQKDRNDYIVVQLASAGRLNSAVIDATGFKGNSPSFIQIDGCHTKEDDPYQDAYTQWISLLAKSSVKEDAINIFAFTNNDSITHVRLTVLPDGGIKHFKCFGFVDDEKETTFTREESASSTTVVDETEEDAPIIDDQKAAIEDIKLCQETKFAPITARSLGVRKQPVSPIEDTELFEKTVLEELDGSTTQLPTPRVEKPQQPLITDDEMEALRTSEKAAIEQLNATEPEPVEEILYNTSETSQAINLKVESNLMTGTQSSPRKRKKSTRAREAEDDYVPNKKRTLKSSRSAGRPLKSRSVVLIEEEIEHVQQQAVEKVVEQPLPVIVTMEQPPPEQQSVDSTPKKRGRPRKNPAVI